MNVRQLVLGDIEAVGILIMLFVGPITPRRGTSTLTASSVLDIWTRCLTLREDALLLKIAVN